MNGSFDPRQALIIVRAQITGPLGVQEVQLALDTGATTTVVRTSVLSILGYDLTTVADHATMLTGSGIESVPRLRVQQIETLGKKRRGFPVIAHTLPPNAPIDGLLGLDFLRRKRLTIDFERGRITLT